MLKLFTGHKDETQYGIRTDSRLNTIKKKYKHDLDKTLNYFLHKESASKSNHFLARILKHGYKDIKSDVWEYDRQVSENIPSLIKLFKITSNYTVGDVFDSEILGENSKELFLAVDSQLDDYYIKKNWRTVRPLKILDHEMIDFTLSVPNHTTDFVVPTFTKFSLDLRLLFIQYKFWAEDRGFMDMDTDPSYFINQVVLPSLISDVFDISIINYIEYLLDIEFRIERDDFKLPFIIVDYRDKLKDIIKDYVDHITNKKDQYEKTLESILLVFSTNLYEQGHLGLVFANRKSKWLVLTSRLKLMNLLIVLGGDKAMKRNTEHIHDFTKHYSLLKNDNSVENVGDLNSQLYIEKIIKRIK